MVGEYYDHTTYPAQGTQGLSGAMRSELESIQAGFDKLPGLAGNASKLVRIKADESCQEAVSSDTLVGDAIAAASAKATPADADKFGFIDSAASWALKYLTWANLKTFFHLKTDDVALAAGKSVIFEGATDDAYETTLGCVDPTAYRSILLPNVSGTLALTSDLVGLTSTDSVARDQIALTNMRLMLSTAVATGPLVQGKHWELTTDEWGGTSTNETYVNGVISYYASSYSAAVSQAAGTAIGNLTGNGGLAAAFDGNTNQARAACADSGSAVAAGYVGKDWGAGTTRVITSAVVDSADDNGFSNSFNTGTNTLVLQGSTDNFSGSVVDLGTTVTAAEGASRLTETITASDVSTAYRYHRIKITNSNGGTQVYCCAEVVFTERVNTNMTLIPDAAVSLSVAPTYMDVFVLYKDDSGSAVMGTDLTIEGSRDDSTYTAGTITTIASYDASYSLIKARIDVSGQPSGTSLSCRIKTLNNKAQRIAAPALYSE